MGCFGGATLAVESTFVIIPEHRRHNSMDVPHVLSMMIKFGVSQLTVCTGRETMVERSCHFGSALWRRYPCGRVYFCDHAGAPESTQHGCAPHAVDDQFFSRVSQRWSENENK